ncbi:biotin-dependent carboxyltransferase family protein [Sandarakinorhabdus sp. DWP1-3-1]|uniref:5-oxoprolinase subunit C family protein n=1 Tax=Sandarakinorhabdus sp. DWP1-3-1 TaxID=2804627 RepID=UPI003CE93EED
MSRAVLQVETAGPLTTIQDAGRPGHRRFGVTPSGPVDRLGFAAAHAALGNPPGGAALELSHGGIVLRCVEGEVGFALTGGDFAARLDGAMLGRWTTGVLRPGMRLAIRDSSAGNWATLAFGGTLEARHWLGSAATLALAGLGGGRVAAGDTLVIAARVPGERSSIVPPVLDTGPIRVIIGPQDNYFAPASVAALLSQPYAAAAAFDRMGMVLDGPLLPPLSVTMLSAPLLRGAIQVNGAGTPTILLADHQTTAGYPRIATVIDADVDRAAQLRPGEPLRFAAVTVAEAIAIARQSAVARTAWLVAVAAGQGSLAERLSSANLIDGVIDAVTGL